MKINQGLQPQTQQGSFGLTPQMRETLERHKRTPVEEPVQEDLEDDLPPPRRAAVQDEFFAAAAGNEETNTPEEKVPLVDSPLDNLKKIGVTLEDEDFQKVLFRGYVEKEIIVVPSIKGTDPLVATFRTITGKEVDEVDELLAEEVKKMEMTTEGYHTRRSMWILAYGVTHLMKKPLCNPIFFKGTRNIDTKATARGRRKVLAGLNPGLLTKMMQYHGILTLAINTIIVDPEVDYLKKP